MWKAVAPSRTSTAIVACVGSVALAYWMTTQGHPATALLGLAASWHAIGEWYDRRLYLLRVPMGQVVHKVPLIKRSPFVQALRYGSLLFALAGILAIVV